ncbi:unnamed protein product [Closterium sp. Naga37s-1]|nr:unnamed protein product [Closterium sp. Naga37s-1]
MATGLDEQAMDERARDGSTWTAAEDKLFETLLVDMDASPDAAAADDARWEAIAAKLPGKTADEVRRHYEVLEEDIRGIESGRVPLPAFDANGAYVLASADVKDEPMTSAGSPRDGSGAEASGARKASAGSAGAGKEKQASPAGQSKQQASSQQQASQGAAAQQARGSEQERRKGIPWTEEEHRCAAWGMRMGKDAGARRAMCRRRGMARDAGARYGQVEGGGGRTGARFVQEGGVGGTQHMTVHDNTQCTPSHIFPHISSLLMLASAHASPLMPTPLLSCPSLMPLLSCPSSHAHLSCLSSHAHASAPPFRLFLLGLAKFGKGDWRSISRNFVISRTPTQVASHAQKYFIRLNAINKDKRRSSIHDITSVAAAQGAAGDAGQQQSGPITGQPAGAASGGAQQALQHQHAHAHAHPHAHTHAQGVPSHGQPMPPASAVFGPPVGAPPMGHVHHGMMPMLPAPGHPAYGPRTHLARPVVAAHGMPLPHMGYVQPPAMHH